MHGYDHFGCNPPPRDTGTPHREIKFPMEIEPDNSGQKEGEGARSEKPLPHDEWPWENGRMATTDIDWQGLLTRHDMIWEKAAHRWLDGIPLANGYVGAMIWGHGNPLAITLDKYDCWELREPKPAPASYNYTHLRKCVDSGDDHAIQKVFWKDIVDPEGPRPTRLPLPRLELQFADEAQEFSARLRLLDATVEGAIGFADCRAELNAFVHATRRLLVIHLVGEKTPAEVEITMAHLTKPPPDGSVSAWDTLTSWGYEKPERGRRSGVDYLRLLFPAGGEYVVAFCREARAQGVDMFLTIVSHNDAHSPLEEAVKAVKAAADEGYDSLHESHSAWWRNFWSASCLTIPDSKLENLYWVEMYKLGCSSRPDGLPITLQGLWTCDGVMPPWSGDYHLDMNVQASYWPVYASNRLDMGKSLYETFFACLPRFERNCREFFGFDGASSGCAIAPDGSRVFGYPTTEFWPGNGAWLAHLYWLHWLYSRDERFLRERAVPFMAAFMRTYMNLLEEQSDGRLHLPLSNSPEYHEGSIKAWGTDSTCDLALIRWLGQSLLDADQRLGLAHPDAARWEDTLGRLADYPRNEEDGLMVCAQMPLAFSHRHHSHLMAVYPLGLISEEDEDWQSTLDTTVSAWRRMGTGLWTGWSFPWASAIAARSGLPNMAWQVLDLYSRCFIAPNSLHVNGDHRSFGASSATYEPMTLEAGFCAAAAIMEMLLQSYSGLIRVFPAIPDHWHDAFFADLRAEGAFLVSSRMRNRHVEYVTVFSEVGGPCRVRNPWNCPARVTGVERSDGCSVLDERVLEFSTEAGVRYLLHPDGIEASNVDLAPPFSVRDAGMGNWFGVKRLARF